MSDQSNQDSVNEKAEIPNISEVCDVMHLTRRTRRASTHLFFKEQIL